MDSCPMDGRIAKLETDVNRLVKVIEGNGQPGLFQEFTDFTAEFRGTQRERDKQHRANTTRLNLIIAALIALAAYITIVQAQHRSSIDPAKIFHSRSAPQVAKDQNADLPPTYNPR